MIILKFMGGLGNQLFQYAFYRNMQTRGKHIKADISFYDKKNQERQWELETFPNVKISYATTNDFRDIYKTVSITDRLFRRSGIINREKEEEFGSYAKRFFEVDNAILEGYFQNINYFKSNEKLLREELQFPVLENKLQSLINDIKSYGNYVSLHVRRGDYLKFENIYGGICTKEYYDKAIQILSEKVKDHKICVLSDDVVWVKNNFNLKNAIFISDDMFDNYQDWYDMCIMSNCKHNIIANSSFSWWGAWLNPNKEKIVIMPDKWDNQRKTTELKWDGWYSIK